MKKNKKLIMGLSFCLGAVMLVTTAFADVVSKSGYDMLKDSAKSTAKAFSEGLDSFTMEGNVVLKDNGKQLFLSNFVQKFDNKKGAMTDTSYTEFANGSRTGSRYSYRDNKTIISYDAYNDTYYVTEFTNERKSVKPFDNPFEDEQWNDVEKILDALVGNLKDYVVVDEKSDGSKELWGTLSEGQIPPLVNAVSSFWFKNVFSGRNGNTGDISMPEITEDIYVKSVSGKAMVNSDGIIESVLTSGVLSGKDKDGNVHDLTLEMLIKVYDINSTTVTKPDLTGKNVEKYVEKGFDEEKITQKYVGKYKNNIVIEKDDKFIKIGERNLEITNIDNKRVSGRYYETYKDEYKEYAGSITEMSFDAEIKDQYYAEFEYTDSSGRTQTGHLSFDMSTGGVYFNVYSIMQGRETMYDGSFARVFDE